MNIDNLGSDFNSSFEFVTSQPNRKKAKYSPVSELRDTTFMVNENAPISKETSSLKNTKLESSEPNIQKIASESLGLPEIIKSIETTEYSLDLASKTFGAWDCVARVKDEKSAGDLYFFKAKPEYNILVGDSDEANNKNNSLASQLFPAVQSTPFGYGTEILNITSEELMKKFFDLSPGSRLTNSHHGMAFKDKSEIFSYLGFKYILEENGDIFITLPDVTALNARWESLRLENPNLPLLTFISSEGIASHEFFIQSFIDGKIPISSGIEFVHDYTAHGIEIILLVYECMQSGINYTDLMNYLRSTIRKGFFGIKLLREKINTEMSDQLITRLFALLSMNVDVMSAVHEPEPLKTFLDNIVKKRMMSMAEHEGWTRYMRENYGLDWNRSLNSFASLIQLFMNNTPIKEINYKITKLRVQYPDYFWE